MAEREIAEHLKERNCSQITQSTLWNILGSFGHNLKSIAVFDYTLISLENRCLFKDFC